MKQTLLLLVLALGMCSINVSAQTKKPVRKATTQTKQKANHATKDSREYQIGEDGYEWYKICKNGKYGAEDRNGYTIVPAEYEGIIYQIICYKCEGYSPVEAGFVVHKGESRGWYNKSGKCIIPYTRGYKSIRKYDDGKFGYGTHYTFTRTDGGGICDKSGREIVAVKISNLVHIEMSHEEFDGRKYYDLLFSIQKNGENLWGIANTDGIIVIAPEQGFNETLKLTTSRGLTTRNPLSDNTRETLAEAEGRAFGSSNASSSTTSSNSSSSSNNSGGGTTTIVVEHQHTPQPMTEWVPCGACGHNPGVCQTCLGMGESASGRRCISCHGTGKCHFCNGQGGRYQTVYR